MKMPPVNLLDPLMHQWLDSVSENKDGVAMPLVHWPNGEPVTYVGFMADDVEKVCPGAVTRINGFRVVDHAKAKRVPGLAVYSFNYKPDAVNVLKIADDVGASRRKAS